MGTTIKIMFLSLLWAKIWTYVIWNNIDGGHLENQYGYHYLHPYYQFHLIPWPWKYGYYQQHHIYLFFELRCGYMYFTIEKLAAILKINMADITYIHIINFIWFLDPENIGVATKIMSLSPLWAEIWTYIVCDSINGGHLENQYEWHDVHPYYQFQWILWPWKHGYSHQNHISMSSLSQDISQNIFSGGHFEKLPFLTSSHAPILVDFFLVD